LFADVIWGEDPLANRHALFRALPPRVPAAYAATLEAVDPNDPTNRKALELRTLTTLVRGGFINAQRGLSLSDSGRHGRVVALRWNAAVLSHFGCVPSLRGARNLPDSAVAQG
jgi:hypothetical protein